MCDLVTIVIAVLVMRLNEALAAQNLNGTNHVEIAEKLNIPIAMGYANGINTNTCHYSFFRESGTTFELHNVTLGDPLGQLKVSEC